MINQLKNYFSDPHPVENKALVILLLVASVVTVYTAFLDVIYTDLVGTLVLFSFMSVTLSM